jgi:hypothetical protein
VISLSDLASRMNCSAGRYRELNGQLTAIVGITRSIIKRGAGEMVVIQLARPNLVDERAKRILSDRGVIGRLTKPGEYELRRLPSGDIEKEALRQFVDLDRLRPDREGDVS